LINNSDSSSDLNLPLGVNPFSCSKRGFSACRKITIRGVPASVIHFPYIDDDQMNKPRSPLIHFPLGKH
jgi:hypothetical protein